MIPRSVIGNDTPRRGLHWFFGEASARTLAGSTSAGSVGLLGSWRGQEDIRRVFRARPEVVKPNADIQNDALKLHLVLDICGELPRELHVCRMASEARSRDGGCEVPNRITEDRKTPVVDLMVSVFHPSLQLMALRHLAGDVRLQCSALCPLVKVPVLRSPGAERVGRGKNVLVVRLIEIVPARMPGAGSG